MKNNWNIGLTTFAIAAMIAIQGCTHSRVNEKVEQKVQAESEVKTATDLQGSVKSTLSEAKGLTDDQRTLLQSLMTDTKDRMDALASESLRLRSVLIKDVLSTSYDAKEVNQLKKKIRNVEGQKVKVIFGAVDKANKIMGRQAAANPDVMHHLIGLPTPGSLQ